MDDFDIVEGRENGCSEGFTVYFNPFVHTIEENSEFIRRGYEVMPIRIPPTDRDLSPRNT
jgi:hypothetical protein